MHGSGTRVEIEREELTLFSERAGFWESQSALLVSDLHIGKGAAFRAGSIPVPAGTSEATLTSLSRLLERTGASRLFMLGDFWHAKEGRTSQILSLIEEWRSKHQNVEMILVEGNHDKKSGSLPPELGIETVPDLSIGPFVLKHHPEEDDRGYVLAGHIHPAVRLIGGGRQTERLPAFWFGPRVGVLPAIGEFTGAATVYPSPTDRVFVVCEDVVREVSLTGAGTA